MNIKQSVLFAALIMGFLSAAVYKTNQPVITPKIYNDTVVIKDTLVSVKNKTALYIGDSHTSNHTQGW